MAAPRPTPTRSSSALPSLDLVTRWFERLSIRGRNGDDARENSTAITSAQQAQDELDDADVDWVMVQSSSAEKEQRQAEKERKLNDTIREWISSKPLSVVVTGKAQGGHQARLINTLLEATDAGSAARSGGSLDEVGLSSGLLVEEHKNDDMDFQWLSSAGRSGPGNSINVYSRTTAYSFEGDTISAPPSPMRSMETDPRSRNVASETTRAGGYKITHFLSDDSDSDHSSSHMSVGEEEASPFSAFGTQDGQDAFSVAAFKFGGSSNAPTISHRRSRSSDRGRGSRDERSNMSSGFSSSHGGRPKAQSTAVRPKTYASATRYVWETKESKADAARPRLSLQTDPDEFATIHHNFEIDEQFNNSIDWAAESQAASTQLISFEVEMTYDQSRSFILPQHSRDELQPSQTIRLRYGDIPSMIVSFPTEAELRLSLWKVHELFENAHLRESAAFKQIWPVLEHRYRRLLGLASDVQVPLRAISAPYELPIPNETLSVLGKNFRFAGNGANAMRDRVFIREKLKEVINSYAFHTPRFLIRLPCSVLSNNREIVEVSAGAALTDLYSQLALADANLLMITVDGQQGIAPEVMSSLAATNMPHKLLAEKNERAAMFLRTDSPNQTPAALTSPEHKAEMKEFREKLLYQFRSFVVDTVQNSRQLEAGPSTSSSYSLKSLERLLQDTSVLSVNPALFASVHLREGYSAELMSDLSTREVLNATSIPTLLSAIPNRQIIQISAELQTLNRALIRSNREATEAATVAPASAEHSEAIVKGQQDISKLVTTFGQQLQAIKSEVPSRGDQIKIFLKLKSRESARALAQYRGSDAPNLFEFLAPLAEATVSSWDRVMAEGCAAPTRQLHQTMQDALAAVQRYVQLYEDEMTDKVLASMTQIDRVREQLSAAFTEFASALMLGDGAKFHDFVRNSVLASLREIFGDSTTIPVAQLPTIPERVSEKLYASCKAMVDASLEKLAIIEKQFALKLTEILQIFQRKRPFKRAFSNRSRSPSSGLLSSPRATNEPSVYELDASQADSASSEGDNDEVSVSEMSVDERGDDDFSSEEPLRKKPFGASSFSSQSILNADPSMEFADHPHDISFFIATLKQSRLRLEATVKDSNSQFRVLAYLMYGMEGAHHVVRLLLVSEILQNRGRYDKFTALMGANSRSTLLKVGDRMGLEEYCHIMSLEGCEGDQIMLIAFSNFFGVDVMLYYADQPQPQVIQSAKASRTQDPVRIAYLPDGFYQPIVFDEIVSKKVGNGQSVSSRQALTNTKDEMNVDHHKRKQKPDLKFNGFSSTLVDLCIAKVAENIQRYPPLGTSLPSDIIQRMINALSVTKNLSNLTLFPLLTPQLNSSSLILNDLVGVRINDDTLVELSRRSRHLTHIELNGCTSISAKGFAALLPSLSQLSSLSLKGSANLPAIAFQDLARRCSKLQSVDLTGCVQLSSGAVQEIMLSNALTLTHLVLAQLPQLTDAALSYLPKVIEYLDLTDAEQLTAKALALIAARAPRLSALKISGRNLTDASIVALAKSCPSLRLLEIPNCPAMSNGALFTVAVKCPLLETLNIEGARGVDDAAFVGNGDAPAIPLPNLRSVNFSKCLSFSDNGIRKFLAGSPKLKVLNLGGCEGLSDNTLLAIAEFTPKLRSLDLTKVAQVTDKGFLAVVGRCVKLQKLVLHNCQQISERAFALVAETLFQLDHLDVSCCAMSAAALAKIAKACSALTHLDVSEIAAIDEDALAHVSMLRNLTVLKAAHCKGMTDRVLALLSQNCPQVRELDLSYCNALTSQSLSKTNVLQNFHYLTSLNLRGFPHDLPSIAHPYLEKLVLSWCSQVEDATINATATQCPSLVHLDLSWTAKLTAHSVHKLVLACQALKTLNIRGCGRISPITIQYLAGASSLIIYR